eukprot:scaffold18456_cov124-Isochrysis_galbana.AAC.10
MLPNDREGKEPRRSPAGRRKDLDLEAWGMGDVLPPKQSKGGACGKGEGERGKGLGVWLGPLLAATCAASRSPRLEYAPNTRPCAPSSADVGIGHRRHAPAGIIIRAPMPSPGSHRHPDVRAGAGGVAAASTRRHPAHHASNTLPPASSSADVAIGHRRHAPARITRAPMPSLGSHRHPDAHPGSGGVAAASTRRHPRGQPLTTPRICASPPPALPAAPTLPLATVATRQPE